MMDDRKRFAALSGWEEACERTKTAIDAAVIDARDLRRQGEYALEAVGNLHGVATRIMGVDCPKCSGIGQRVYPSTATWRGGMGGASMTTGVCDVCWGTGRTDQKGPDLRKLEGEIRRLEKEASLRWLEQEVGASLHTVRIHLPTIADKLRKARWGKDGGNFWLRRCVDNVVRILDEMSKEQEDE